MHLYIVVNCKTQDCRTVHVLTHLGEEGKTPAKVEYWMSYPLIVDCPNCGNLRFIRFRREIPAKRAPVSPAWIFK
jgi:hypothetical protein